MKNILKLIRVAALVAAIGFTVIACNNGTTSSTKKPGTTGNGTAPAISTASLPDGEAGTAYSQTLAATGDAPITWSVESGDLPGGLTLSSAGAITGTPAAAGAFDFTVKAANAAGNGTKQLSITIAPHIYGPFNTIADFAEWLDEQSTNTIATAYNVKVNIAALGGDYLTAGSLGDALNTNRSPAKYVNLDLSGSTFTSIVMAAFSNQSTLTSITIPNSVTTIVDSAFNGCTNLTSVIIGNRVTSIRFQAFRYCSSLTSVTIPNSVTTIQESAFYNCTKLTSVTFEGTIPSSSFSTTSVFDGDLRNKFYATDSTNGTPGTYTRVGNGTTWTKQ